MTQPLITSDQLTLTDDDVVEHASDIIRSACGWHIFPSMDSDEVYSGTGSQYLQLRTKYLTAVIAVGVIDYSGTVTTLVEGTDFRKTESGLLERLRGHWWPSGVATVEVQFTHGYDTAPQDLVAVATSFARRWPAAAQPWTAMTMGRASVSLGQGLGAGGKGLAPGSFSSAEQIVLSRYTLVGL